MQLSYLKSFDGVSRDIQDAVLALAKRERALQSRRGCLTGPSRKLLNGGRRPRPALEATSRLRLKTATFDPSVCSCIFAKTNFPALPRGHPGSCL